MLGILSGDPTLCPLDNNKRSNNASVYGIEYGQKGTLQPKERGRQGTKFRRSEWRLDPVKVGAESRRERERVWEMQERDRRVWEWYYLPLLVENAVCHKRNGHCNCSRLSVSRHCERNRKMQRCEQEENTTEKGKQRIKERRGMRKICC